MEGKHTAIFKQQIEKMTYKFSEYKVVDYYYNIQGYHTLIELDLEEPKLQKGQKFYIDKLDKIVTIWEVIRTCDSNRVIYIIGEHKFWQSIVIQMFI